MNGGSLRRIEQAKACFAESDTSRMRGIAQAYRCRNKPLGTQISTHAPQLAAATAAREQIARSHHHPFALVAPAQ